MKLETKARKRAEFRFVIIIRQTQSILEIYNFICTGGVGMKHSKNVISKKYIYIFKYKIKDLIEILCL